MTTIIAHYSRDRSIDIADKLFCSFEGARYVTDVDGLIASALIDSKIKGHFQTELKREDIPRGTLTLFEENKQEGGLVVAIENISANVQDLYNIIQYPNPDFTFLECKIDPNRDNAILQFSDVKGVHSAYVHNRRVDFRDEETKKIIDEATSVLSSFDAKSKGYKTFMKSLLYI